MRSARAATPATYFLGVRLTSEEVALLDKFRTDHSHANRSDAVRALVRGAGGVPAPGVEVSPTILGEIEELVEDGYAPDRDAALAAILAVGLEEFARTHTERLPAMRERARSLAGRQRDRKRADREGRGLLRR